MKLSVTTIIFFYSLTLGSSLRLVRDIEPDLDGLDYSLIMEKDPPVEVNWLYFFAPQFLGTHSNY